MAAPSPGICYLPRQGGDKALRHRFEADARSDQSPEEAREAALDRLVENFGGRQAKDLLAALQTVQERLG